MPAHSRIVGDDEFVELRRPDTGIRHHRMHLTAMMGLVLEQMAEDIIHALVLDSVAAMDGNRGPEFFDRQCIGQQQ